MSRRETLKFLALVRLAYPIAYRDLDQTVANATVNMWMKTFCAVPFEIMQYAFDCYRMISKYPPTIADMVAQLKSIHNWAKEGYHLHSQMGNTEEMVRFKSIINATAEYSVSVYRPRLGPIYTMNKRAHDAKPALIDTQDDTDNREEQDGNA